MSLIFPKRGIKESELCVKHNVSRKTMDEWVKNILDYENPNGSKVTQGKTRFFNEDEVRKLWQIKEFKEYDDLCRTHEYTYETIRAIFNGKKSHNVKEFRTKYISLLKYYRDEYDRQIKYEEFILSSGIIPNNFFVSDYDYDGIKTYFLNLFDNISINEEELEKYFTDEDIEFLADVFERISNLYRESHSYDSPEVQQEIKNIHKYVSKITSESVVIFSKLADSLLLNAEIIEDLELNSDDAEFLIRAVKCYSNNCEENEIDVELENFEKKLYELFECGKKPCSDEVQSEIKKLYKIVCEIPFLRGQEMAAMDIIKKIYYIHKERVVPICDKNMFMFLYKLIAEAIEYFCKNFDTED